jgi:hypothetical protein
MERKIPDFDAIIAADQLLPIAGFSRIDAELSPPPPPVAAIWPATRAVIDDAKPCSNYAVAKAHCSLSRIAANPYLQCELHFSQKRGALEIYSDSELVDRAELVEGWQHAAVSLISLPDACDISVRFLDAEGHPVDGTIIKALFLSDTWGRGQRKRLKCYVPFTSTNVFADFSIYPCCARQWLKPGLEAGNAKANNIAELWNGPVYQKMRADFLAGDYDASCRSDVCPLLFSEQLPVTPPNAVIHAVNEGLTQVDYGPCNMHHDVDYGCNLACTMCRDAKILPNSDNIDQALADIKNVVDLGSLEEISFSGAGEVFIMAKMVKLMESDYFSSRNIRIDITSNLTHFTEKLWQRIRHNYFHVFAVSADGCSEETYQKVRTGAKWSTVARNMEFLAALRAEHKINYISWQYTVQKANVGDVANSIVKARELGFDTIRLIAQMGALSRTNGNMFEDYDAAALDQLYDQIESVDGFDDPRVILSELGIDNRRYRTVERRLELAEFIYDRTGFSADGVKLASSENWEKCRHIVEGVVGDTHSGNLSRVAPLPRRHRNFVKRFLQTARANQASTTALGWVIRNPSKIPELYAEHRFLRQVAGLLRD